MSLTRNTGGAWGEIGVLKRPASGAYQEADAAFRHESGAWKEVWSNGPKVTFVERTVGTGTTQTVIQNGEGIKLYGYYPDYSSYPATNTASSVKFELEGNFGTSAVISLDWVSGFYYNTPNRGWYSEAGGQLSFSGGSGSGMTNLGKDGQNSWPDSGKWSYTFNSGSNITKISIVLSLRSRDTYSGCGPIIRHAEIKNLSINGQLYKFGSEFNS